MSSSSAKSDVPSYASALKFISVSCPFPFVLHVELARSPVNAFSEPFWREYGTLFDDIAKDPTIRAAVLSSGLQKAFSVGVDLDFLTGLVSSSDPARTALITRPTIREFQQAIAAPTRCLCPVIAAVHGVAFGLAIDMVSACDVRYAANDVKFSIKEVDVGLAADIGTLARLPKLTGNASLLNELALTGRIFGAEEAKELGMVSRITPGSRVEVVQAALELAKEIASKSPVAVVGTKHLLAHARDHTIDDNLEYTITWNSAMLQAPDLVNATRAAMKKQKTDFEPIGTRPGGNGKKSERDSKL